MVSRQASSSQQQTTMLCANAANNVHMLNAKLQCCKARQQISQQETGRGTRKESEEWRGANRVTEFSVQSTLHLTVGLP